MESAKNEFLESEKFQEIKQKEKVQIPDYFSFLE
jgi:hypothetical protein